jgi:hypothetical protein
VEADWSNTPLGGAVYAQHTRMIEFLGRYSRDIWELAFVGNVERLRELFAAHPELAKDSVRGAHADHVAAHRTARYARLRSRAFS